MSLIFRERNTSAISPPLTTSAISNIYINDLYNVPNILQPIIFVEDANRFSSPVIK